MKLTDFKALTFDCYGTLIDWEIGILNGLQPLARKLPSTPSRDEILEIFGQNESAQEDETPATPYSQLLSLVYKRIARSWGVTVTHEDANVFGASIPEWPAFSDSVGALKYLKNHYKLIILSNVDRISFRASNARLQVTFDAVYTAEDIDSYKPSPENFRYMLRRLKDDFGLEKNGILHIAQSLFHDHAPANQFGLASAWIDRRHAETGWGATKPPVGSPTYHFRFDSMAAFVEAHRRELLV
jgi:2-haloacid dehalogenase